MTKNTHRSKVLETIQDDLVDKFENNHAVLLIIEHEHGGREVEEFQWRGGDRLRPPHDHEELFSRANQGISLPDLKDLSDNYAFVDVIEKITTILDLMIQNSSDEWFLMIEVREYKFIHGSKKFTEIIKKKNRQKIFRVLEEKCPVLQE